MVKLMERQVLLVKNEITYGVDSLPTGSDNAISIVEATRPEYDVKVIERPHALDSLSKVTPLVGSRFTKMSFRTEFFGSGVEDVSPRIGTLIKGCGFQETINIGSDITYHPASENPMSNTLLLYVDGLLYKMLGSVGNFKLSAKSGEPCYFDFDYQGLYQDDADSSIVTPTFEPNYKKPPLCLSCSFSLDAISSFVVREFNLDMGITLINRESMTSETGYAGFIGTKRNPTGNIVIEAEEKAVYDFLDKWEKSTEISSTLSIGSLAGNRLDIVIPNLSFTNVNVENQDGIAVLNIPISINQGTGDDEISLKCS